LSEWFLLGIFDIIPLGPDRMICFAGQRYMVSEVLWHLMSEHAWTHRHCLGDGYSTPLAILFLLIMPNHSNCLRSKLRRFALLSLGGLLF
jgi:hypothetical protein